MISKEEREFLEQSNYIEREYSQQALEDAEKAWLYALKKKDRISKDYILNIHKRLMKRLRRDIAGKFRDCAVYIGGRKVEFNGKQELEKQVDDWIDFCSGALDKTEGEGMKGEGIRGEDKEGVEERIKQCHVRFEYIHPFRDGNGRVGRILMNIHRINAGLPILIIHEGREQRAYYGWFEK